MASLASAWADAQARAAAQAVRANPPSRAAAAAHQEAAAGRAEHLQEHLAVEAQAAAAVARSPVHEGPKRLGPEATRTAQWELQGLLVPWEAQ